MKKILIFVTIALTIFCFSGIASATDKYSNMEGAISIAGLNNRPPITNLAVSANSYVAYATTSTTRMAAAATSGKASAEDVLIFQVVGNQTPGEGDDSNIYQKAPGTVQTSVATEAPTASAKYFIRGTGSVSTYTAPATN